MIAHSLWLTCLQIVLVPYTSNPDFVGRSSILDQLKDVLGHGLAQAIGTSHPRASLYGLGGVGYAIVTVRSCTPGIVLMTRRCA